MPSVGSAVPGDKVPSESQLMEHFGVARMTVRQALSELRAEGLLVAEHGRGVFVRERPVVRRVASDRFARRHREAGRLRSSLRPRAWAPVRRRDRGGSGGGVAEVREALALPARAGSWRAIGATSWTDSQWSLRPRTSRVHRQGHQDRAADTGPGGIYARLEEAGHALAEFIEEVAARMPTPEERRRLRLPPEPRCSPFVGWPLTREGRRVELTDTVKAAPGYVLEYRFPAI